MEEEYIMKDKVSGIYKITNTVTGEFYIGSSKNIRQRWYTHKVPSVWKKHPNIKLYQDMSRLGDNNFIIETIEETDNLREREQYWIEKLHPSYNDRQANGYNEERKRKSMNRGSRKYYRAHKETMRAKKKEYDEKHHIENIERMKNWRNQLCLYNGEEVKLHTLMCRFRKQGIANPTQEAKKYLK